MLDMTLLENRQAILKWAQVKGESRRLQGAIAQVAPSWTGEQIWNAANGGSFPGFGTVPLDEFAQASRAQEWLFKDVGTGQIKSTDDAVEFLIKGACPFVVIGTYNSLLQSMGLAPFVFTTDRLDEFWDSIDNGDAETLKEVLESRDNRDILDYAEIDNPGNELLFLTPDTFKDF